MPLHFGTGELKMEDRKNNAVTSDKRFFVYLLRNGIKPKDMFIHCKSDSVMYVYDKTETQKYYEEFYAYKHKK